MQRRGFLGAILGAAAAPAIVRAQSLMLVVPRILVPLTLAERIAAGTVMVGQRDDLSDLIYRISPTHTPFLALFASRGVWELGS